MHTWKAWIDNIKKKSRKNFLGELYVAFIVYIVHDTDDVYIVNGRKLGMNGERENLKSTFFFLGLGRLYAVRNDSQLVTFCS